MFELAIMSQPLPDMPVTVTTTSADADIVSIISGPVTFSSFSWGKQCITVAGIDSQRHYFLTVIGQRNNNDDGNQTVSIYVNASSTDQHYNGRNLVASALDVQIWWPEFSSVSMEVIPMLGRNTTIYGGLIALCMKL